MEAATIALVVVPFLIIQVGMMLFALYDLFQEDRRVRGDSKAMWALIIFLVNVIGPLIYFFVGRDESRGTETGGSGAAPTEPISRILATWPKLSETTDAAVTTTGLTKRYPGGGVAPRETEPPDAVGVGAEQTGPDWGRE